MVTPGVTDISSFKFSAFSVNTAGHGMMYRVNYITYTFLFRLMKMPRVDLTPGDTLLAKFNIWLACTMLSPRLLGLLCLHEASLTRQG